MKRTPKPFTIEVRRSGSRRPIPPIVSVKDPFKRPTPQPVLGQDERPPEPIKGRILPALEPKEPAVAPRIEDPLEASPLDVEMDEADLIEEPIAAVPEDFASDPVPDIDETILGTQTRSLRIVVRARKPVQDLPRDAFRRGERWKHRLPEVIHHKHAKHNS